MRANLMVLIMMLVSGSLSLPNDLSVRPTLSPTVAAAQSQLDSASPIEGLSISRQSWVREGGFLIAEITFANENEFPVQGVTIACDFFDPAHLYIGRRGSLILRILPAGETTIGGIEFTMLKQNIFDPDIFGGACRVASNASAISGDRGTFKPTDIRAWPTTRRYIVMLQIDDVSPFFIVDAFDSIGSRAVANQPTARSHCCRIGGQISHSVPCLRSAE